MRNYKFPVIVLVALFLIAPAVAQRKGSGYPGCTPQCSTKCVDHNWHHMAASFDNLRLIKLLEAVDLDEDQSTRFIPIFHSFRKSQKQLREDRRVLIDQLAELSSAKDKSAEIDQAIKSLKENSDSIESARDKFHQGCRQILASDQLARMLVFQERFEREILKSLREFRHMRGASKASKP